MKKVQMKDDEGKKTWCLVDNHSTGREYTICGDAWTDSSLEQESVEHTGKIKDFGKVTCKKCISKIKWIKSLEL